MDRFCTFCGAAHVTVTYPRLCIACNETTWRNPAPVAVLLQPVRGEDGRTGILTGERAIEPSRGLFGLPGGFVDPGDISFEAAAARELMEEMGLVVAAEDLTLDHSFSDGSYILVFLRARTVLSAGQVLRDFQPSEECPRARIIYAPEPLAFDSHSRAVARFFAGLG